MVMCTGSSNRVMTETIEKRMKVKKVKGKAGIPADKSRSTRSPEILDEMNSLLSEQSLPECPSFLEKTSKIDGVVAEDLYSVFASELLFNFYFEMPKLLKTGLI